MAVVAMMGGERLPLALIGLITDRIRRAKQLFARVAARVAAGLYIPRHRAAAPRPGQKPPPPDRLPRNFGWLLKLVPDSVGYRSQLENLLRDPEMAALLAAAPVPMARALRPLCRMLGLPPPPILAPPPRKPRPKRAKAAAAPQPPPRPPPPELPAWMRIGAPRKEWSLARIRGPRHRA
jgi:hypothetical protein